MISAGFLGVALLNLFPHVLTGGWIVGFMVLLGLIMLGQNVGMIVGPVLFAAPVD